MDNLEKFSSQYDLYLSFLSRKIDSLEEKLNKISRSEFEQEYFKSLPDKVEIIPDSILEFYSGWGRRDYDSRGNPFRPLMLDRVIELRFEINRSKGKKMAVSLYSDLQLKLAYFVDFMQITPEITEKNGVYKITCDLPRKMHESIVSFIIVCPPKELDSYKEKGIVFIEALVN